MIVGRENERGQISLKSCLEEERILKPKASLYLSLGVRIGATSVVFTWRKKKESRYFLNFGEF